MSCSCFRHTLCANLLLYRAKLLCKLFWASSKTMNSKVRSRIESPASFQISGDGPMRWWKWRNLVLIEWGDRNIFSLYQDHILKTNALCFNQLEGIEIYRQKYPFIGGLQSPKPSKYFLSVLRFWLGSWGYGRYPISIGWMHHRNIAITVLHLKNKEPWIGKTSRSIKSFSHL